jgi:hypothetical protein
MENNTPIATEKPSKSSMIKELMPFIEKQKTAGMSNQDIYDSLSEHIKAGITFQVFTVYIKRFKNTAPVSGNSKDTPAEEKVFIRPPPNELVDAIYNLHDVSNTLFKEYNRNKEFIELMFLDGRRGIENQTNSINIKLSETDKILLEIDKTISSEILKINTEMVSINNSNRLFLQQNIHHIIVKIDTFERVLKKEIAAVHVVIKQRVPDVQTESLSSIFLKLMPYVVAFLVFVNILITVVIR